MKVKHFIPAVLFISILIFSFDFKENIQLVKTQLRITIVNDLGTQKEGVKVTLYGNGEDYHASENPVQEGMTDSKGRVSFKDLESKVYWVHAVKENMSNEGLGVQTDTLQAKRLNQVTIVIQ